MSPWTRLLRPLYLLPTCAVLLGVFYAIALLAVRHKCATYDEVIHGPAGYLRLLEGDYRINPEEPPLWQKFSALPHLFAKPLNLRQDLPEWKESLSSDRPAWTWCMAMLYQTPGNDADAFFFRSRAIMLILGVAVGALAAWWSWKLAGALGALVTTVAFSLDPNFLAHSSLVKSDLPFTLALLAMIYTVWRLGQRVTWVRFGLTGLLCGAVVSAKFSGVVIAPLFLLLLLLLRSVMKEPWPFLKWELRSVGSKLSRAAALYVGVALIAYIVVWAGYGFRYRPTPQADESFQRQRFIDLARYKQLRARHLDLPPTEEEIQAWQPSFDVRLVKWADDLHLMPQAWLYGFLFTYSMSLTRGSFLMDQISGVGWWYYFPLAMLFKTPTATLLGLFAAPVVGGIYLLRRRVGADAAVVEARRDKSSGRSRRKEKGRASVPPAAPAASAAVAAGAGAPASALIVRDLRTWDIICLALPVVLYMLMSLTTNLNIGLRHVLPVYPFLFIYLGLAAARAVALWGRSAGLVLAGLGVVLAMETAFAFPDYLPFFNTPSGGARGGLHLLGDSNLDWGQDVPLLADWRKKHPEGTLYYSYFGALDPHYYGLDFVPLPGLGTYYFNIVPTPCLQARGPGYIAVHATNLQGIYLPAWRAPGLPEGAFYAKLRDEAEPIAILGGSIYVYAAP